MEGWQRISIRKLAWFTSEATEKLRWKIEKHPNGRSLQIVTRRGTFDLKINGGIWIRKQTKKD